MFKLVVLSVFIAVAAAKPGLLVESPVVAGYSASILKPQLEVHAPLLKTTLLAEPSHVAVQESTIAKVGEVVHSVPTAVSHQSSTIVHSKANVVTPIVAPAVKTYAAPIVKTIAAAPLAYAAGPIVSPYAPVLNSYSASAPLLKSYTSGPLYAHGAPLAYAAAPIAYAHGAGVAYAHSAPLAYAHAAPVLKSYAGPLAYSAPVVHAW